MPPETTAEPEQSVEETEAPESTGAEESPESPDLSEQEQAMAARLAGPLADAVAERINTGQESEPESDFDGDFADVLAGDPEDVEPEEEGEYDEPEGESEGQEDPLLQHPYFQQLYQEHEQLKSYLIGREEREDRQALNKFAADNPAVNEPEVKRALVAGVHQAAQRIAERAGDPGLQEHLQQDPFLVETVFHRVMRERASGAQVPAEEARNQGAPLETDAGASQSAEPSYQEQALAEIKQAGGSAFPV